VVFRESCGLRKTLSSLSDDEWGYIPALLIVWPEAPQHWSLMSSVSCSVMPDRDCSLPGFSVHEILQARILEWVAISFSSGSP